MVRPLYVELPCALRPLRTPFDGDSEADAGALFVYMSARRVEGWSHLFAADANYWKDCEAHFPMGYTQLWVFEKRYCSKPDKIRTAPKPVNLEALQHPPESLQRRDWAGSLYAVLRQPAQGATDSDLVCYLTDPTLARRAAHHYAWTHKRAAVVALMRADEQWH